MSITLILLLLPIPVLIGLILRFVHARHMTRLRMPRRLRRRMRRALALQDSSAPLSVLRRRAQALSEALLQLKADLHRAPLLPCAEDGLPRFHAPVQRLTDEGALSAEALAGLIAQSPGTLAEREQLPLYAGVLLAQSLCQALDALLLDARRAREGRRLARRISRHAHREVQLPQALHPAVIAALRTELHALHAGEAAVRAEALLARLPDADAPRRHAHAQTLLADRLEAICEGFGQLSVPDWPVVLEEADPLHALLVQDPAGVYARMDAGSRRLYRQAIARLASVLHAGEEDVARRALSLSQQADADALERHVGWWLLEHAGRKALKRSLGRRGKTRLFFERHALSAKRLTLLALNVLTSLLFLRRGYTLWLLPVFLPFSSAVLRRLLRPLLQRLNPPQARPRLQPEALQGEHRTLVVLPTVLRDSHGAIHAVRELLTARHALNLPGADYLLLADWEPAMTQRRGEDFSVLTAARAAIEAAAGDEGGDVRYYYIHRSRTWDPKRRIFRAHRGSIGALETLCRLTARGTLPDALDEATVDPASLFQRYAWVMTLQPGVHLEPRALAQLIGEMAHPLNARRHLHGGARGAGMLLLTPQYEPSAQPTHLARQLLRTFAPRSVATALIRPGALLEDAEEYAVPERAAALLVPLLCGFRRAPAKAFHHPPQTLEELMQADYERALQASCTLPWQFTHAVTDAGVMRNPLPSAARFELRQQLRRVLLPLCQTALCLAAIAQRDGWMLLLALFAPLSEARAPVTSLLRAALLPLAAWLHGDALVRAALSLGGQRPFAPLPAAAYPSGALWSQAIFTAACIALSVLKQPWFWPGLALGAFTALYPLWQAWLERPASPPPALTRGDAAQLRDLAASTWRFFTRQTGDGRALPPDFLQLDPVRAEAEGTSPMTAAMYLLSCVCARECGFIDPDELSARIGAALDALEALPRHEGFFFACADSSSAAVIPAAENGWLCAALLTSAQALRVDLESLGDAAMRLPARADELARAMSLGRLYDDRAGYFRAWLNPSDAEQTAPHLRLFADESLMLSFLAVMRGEVPADHLARLRRTRVRLGRARPLLTRHGDAGESLLGTLLLPSPPGSFLHHLARSAAAVHRKNGRDGVFGQGKCASFAFDARLRAIVCDAGAAEIALHPGDEALYAPYACALCLPFMPQAALASLDAMRGMGACGRLGFLDGIDFAAARLPAKTGHAVVRVHNAAHQGMILCALCNLLHEDALVRRFLSLPGAEGCALLLRDAPALTLPSPRLFSQACQPQEESFRRAARADTAPVDAHLIGSSEASILVSARGSGVVRLKGQDVNRFRADASLIEGPQLYWIHSGAAHRLLSGELPGETVFSEGGAAFTRRCGPFRCTVTLLTDPCAGAALFVLDVENTRPLEQEADFAFCAVPAFDAPVLRPDAAVLALETDSPRLTLSLHGTAPLTAVQAQTSRDRFLSGGDWHAPRSLLQPPAEGLQDAFTDVCLSLRVQRLLPAHGRETLTFALCLQDAGAALYQPPAPDSLRLLSRLSARTLAQSMPVTQQQASGLSAFAGALMWRGQPHQGASEPLQSPPPSPEAPFLCAVVESPAGLPLLEEAVSVAAWMALHGRSIRLAALCLGENPDLPGWIREKLDARPGVAAQFFLHPTEAQARAIQAAAALTLHESKGSAAQQLSQLQQVLPAAAGKPAAPEELSADLPETAFFNGMSGFDLQTGDCMISLDPRQPVPDWPLLQSGVRTACEITPGGIGPSRFGEAAVRQEQVFLRDEPSGETASLTPYPCGRTLRWQIRFSPRVVQWRTRFSALDLTLSAACLPRSAAGIRTLRVRNLSREARRLTLHIAAFFAPGPSGEEGFLTALNGCVTLQRPGLDGAGFLALAEGECTPQVFSPLGFTGCGALPAGLDAPGSRRGSVGVLAMELELPPRGSADLSWLTGFVRQLDDLELLRQRLRRSGASAVYRLVRQRWTQRLSALRFDTPEDSLNLLLNHWLAAQFLDDDDPLTLPARTLLEPESVRPRLLLLARDHAADDLLPLLTAEYVRISGDDAALNDLVPHHASQPDEPRETLYARCLQAVMLPASGQRDNLVRMLGCAAFLPWADASEQELLRDRLSALQSECPLPTDDSDALTAALSVLALGPVPAAVSAVRSALRRGFDPQYGLLRLDASPESPQDTLAAAAFLAALCALGWTEDAWMLLRALNPIHHTDDPARLAEYRGAPWRIPQRVLGAPPHQGQAGRRGSAAAAAVLYATVTERLLGLRHQGGTLCLHPMLPPEWRSCRVTLRRGAAQWQIELCSGAAFGEECCASLSLTDDGREHHVRAGAPLAVK